MYWSARRPGWWYSPPPGVAALTSQATMGADPVQLMAEAVIARTGVFSAKAGPSSLGVLERSRPAAPEVDGTALPLTAALSLGRGCHLPYRSSRALSEKKSRQVKGRTLAARGRLEGDFLGPLMLQPEAPASAICPFRILSAPLEMPTVGHCIHLPRGHGCPLLREAPYPPFFCRLPGRPHWVGAAHLSTFSRSWGRRPLNPSFQGSQSASQAHRRGEDRLTALSAPSWGPHLLDPQPAHTASHSPDIPATAPTFDGTPGLASDCQSESRVSSRAQASSWERCMVPLRRRGTRRRQQEQMPRQTRSGLAGLLCERGSQSYAVPTGCALSPQLRSRLYKSNLPLMSSSRPPGRPGQWHALRGLGGGCGGSLSAPTLILPRRDPAAWRALFRLHSELQSGARTGTPFAVSARPGVPSAGALAALPTRLDLNTHPLPGRDHFPAGQVQRQAQKH